MSEHKAIYSVSWNCGPALLVPVSINVGGRIWENREILVSIARWNAGERKFGFAYNHAVGLPEYTVTPKIAQRIQKAVDAAEAHAKLYEEYRKLIKHVEELENSMEELESDLVACTISRCTGGESMLYLVRYAHNGETQWQLMTAQEIAQSIGNDNGRSNHCIWRLLPNAEPLAVKIRNVSKYHEVWLFDRFDNFIESGTC